MYFNPKCEIFELFGDFFIVRLSLVMVLPLSTFLLIDVVIKFFVFLFLLGYFLWFELEFLSFEFAKILKVIYNSVLNG